MCERPLSLAVVCAVLATSASADVLFVDQSGAGGAFTTIQAAVDSAADGDVVLVHTGTYPAFTIASKGVSVVAYFGAAVTIQGEMRVTGVPASSVALLQGLTGTGINTVGGTTHHAVELSSNAGHVRIEDCTLHGADGISTPSGSDPSEKGWAAIDVHGSARCVIARAVLRGGNAFQNSIDFFLNTSMESALQVSDASTCAAWDLDARAGTSGLEMNGGDGARVAHFDTSSLFASGSYFQGMGGGVGTCPCGQGGSGGSGVWTGSGSSSALLDCELLFGPGASSCGTFGCASIQPGPPGAPTSGPGSLTLHTGMSRSMVARSPVREGAEPMLTFYGAPGDRVDLIASSTPAFVDTPAWRGVRTAGGAHPRYKRVGVIPASGFLSIPTRVTSLPGGVVEETHFLQARFTDASGQSFLGTPATQVVVDASL